MFDRLVALFGEALEALGGGVWREEVRHWVGGGDFEDFYFMFIYLMIYILSLPPFSVLPVSYMWTEMWPSGLTPGLLFPLTVDAPFPPRWTLQLWNCEPKQALSPLSCLLWDILPQPQKTCTLRDGNSAVAL